MAVNDWLEDVKKVIFFLGVKKAPSTIRIFIYHIQSDYCFIFYYLKILSSNIDASFYLCSLTILAWGLSRLCLEKADKVLRIFKAEALADLRYAEGFIYK